MHPQRRIKMFIAVSTAILLILYCQNDIRNIRNQRFYRTTVEAMESREAAKHSAKDDDRLFQKLQPNRVPADEQVWMPNTRENNTSKNDGDVEEVSVAPEGQEKETEAKDEASSTKAELDSILKRSPVIIFSKSYCPYSARAKSILLDKYSITPAPYVVELNQHPIGPELQELLGERTGRHTVPNILVNGKSIGGGDDIAALDENGELASTLKRLGGSWIMEVNGKEN